jgi:hypothetical protein
VAAVRRDIDVLYGVFSLHTHQVSMPVNPRAGIAPENVNLAPSPTHPQEFSDLAYRMAELSKPRDPARPSWRPSGAEHPQGQRSLDLPLASAPSRDLVGIEMGAWDRDDSRSTRALIGREMNVRPL